MTIDDIVNGIEEQYGVLMAQEGADVQALTQECNRVISGLRKHAAILDKRRERRTEEIAAGEILSIARLAGASRSTNPTRIAMNLNRLRDTLDMADSPEGLGQGRIRRPRPDR